MNPNKVRYQVIAKVSRPQVANDFIEWLRVEHAAEVLSAPGCEEYRIFQISDLEISCEYLFQSLEFLNSYFENLAPQLRSKGRAKFPESEVSFSRNITPLILEGLKKN